MTVNPTSQHPSTQALENAAEASLTPADRTGTELGLTKFLDPLRVPPTIKIDADPRRRQVEVVAKAAHVRLHSQLPPTRVWGYDGHFPGPTFDVRRGQKLWVAWRNAIKGSFPLTAVELENATPGPGRDGAEPRADIAALPPWLVVHLHGARSRGGSDGWTENAVLPGETQLVEYLNDQQATALWYHDHAMAITSLNVVTGLAGMYLIRDDEEDALHLPHGKHEVPLIICDRNLDLDANGDPTGDLLYKQDIIQTEPMVLKLPFSGPFTLVNGVIWPHLEVDARWYRFRMLNSSNFRPYTFELHDEDGAPIAGALRQIGSDGGLLPAPAALKDLTLWPGERADVLIDFSTLHGTSPRLVNTLAPPLPPGAGTPNPDVMQFRVGTKPVHDPFTLPTKLSTSFVRLTHDTLAPHMHRWLVLVLSNTGHPELWEMEEIDAAPPYMPQDGIVQVKLADGTLTTLQRVNRTFKDATHIYVEHNAWEQWKFLNVSPVTHPMHLHLTQFQAISRDMFDVTSFDAAVSGTSAPVTYKQAGTLQPGEQGWKDVIQVGGGELVSIAGEFVGGTGRYVHHCHILEHEDEGMMRTFVVMPREVMAVDPTMPDDHDHH
jgi:o-aminophenol oxidase